MSGTDLKCRRVVQGLGAGLLLPALGAPAVIVLPKAQSKLTDGVQSGDVQGDRALVQNRTDRPVRMIAEWDTRSVFSEPCRLVSPVIDECPDYTVRIDLCSLLADQSIFYRVRFEDARSGSLSKPWLGHPRSAPSEARDIRLVWSGGTCGQGLGVNPDIDGMRTYEAICRCQPDFFLHSDDTIYADGPIPEHVETESGRIWHNRVIEAKSKAAETLDEFRGNYRYNLFDDNLHHFNAKVPQIWQWDDHETTNNWSPSKQLDECYQVKDIDVLAAHVCQAFLEYVPLRFQRQGRDRRVYHRVAYGLLLDVFVLGVYSYRGGNSANLRMRRNVAADFLGREQLRWLKRELRGSRAQWKVTAVGVPTGLCVPNGKDTQGRDCREVIANGNDGVAIGRELEIADLLRFVQRARMRNTVWLTADVRYCTAYHYSLERAAFKDFAPLWELVAGPLNVGSLGPNVLDGMFGLQMMFQKAPPIQSSSPFVGYQFFGKMEIGAQSRTLTVTLRDLNDKPVFSQELQSDGA